MANISHILKHYNSIIRLSDADRNKLITERDLLRKFMKAGFAAIPDKNGHELDFQSQGSFVTDLIIKPVNDDFDLDDGVYFQGNLSAEERPKPKVFHDWVKASIGVYEKMEKIIDKPTCIRVQFKDGFHIDIPIYYADNYQNPDLAHLEKNWMLSNPVEFIAWFEEIANSGFQKEFLLEGLKYAEPYEKWLSDVRKLDCQLRRIVRYLKAWADLKRKEMPCGIIMTILVARNYVVDDRDDISLRNTLVNIKNYLIQNGFKCPRPTEPLNEDLFAWTEEADKTYFSNALNGLIHSLNLAISANTEKAACEELEKHFNGRFPSHLAKTVITTPKEDLSALKRMASQNQPWCSKS